MARAFQMKDNDNDDDDDDGDDNDGDDNDEEQQCLQQWLHRWLSAGTNHCHIWLSSELSSSSSSKVSLMSF